MLSKFVAKKVGKRLLNTGLDTGMQIAWAVNRQFVKRAAKSKAKAGGKSFLSGAHYVRTLCNKAVGEKFLIKQFIIKLNDHRATRHPSLHQDLAQFY